MLDKTPHFATVPASDLASANRLLGYVVERRSSIPILDHARIDVKDGMMTVRATDLDREMTITLPCEGSSGAALMPVHAVMKTLPGMRDDISLRVEADTVHFDTAGLRFKRPMLPLDDFPEAWTPEITAQFKIDAQELGWALERCNPAISTEETRYYLNGVYLHWRLDSADKDSLVCVATDGHKLTLCRIDGAVASMTQPVPLLLPPPAKGKKAAKQPKAIKVQKSAPAPLTGLETIAGIIPRKTVHILLKLLSKIDDGQITVSQCGTTKMIFECENWRLTTKLIDGTFPDYGRIIPSLTPTYVTVDAGELANTLATIDGLTESIAVRLNVAKGKLRLSLGGDQEHTVEEIDAEVHGKVPEFGVNMRYLQAACWLMHGDKISLRIHDGGSPLRVEDPAQDEGDMIHVLMPMRV